MSSQFLRFLVFPILLTISNHMLTGFKSLSITFQARSGRKCDDHGSFACRQGYADVSLLVIG